MKLKKEDLEKCPDFRILECRFEERYCVVDFNKFEINITKKTVDVGIMRLEEVESMVKLSALTPYYDTDTDRKYLESVKSEFDKIIQDQLRINKKKNKEKSKDRKG